MKARRLKKSQRNSGRKHLAIFQELMKARRLKKITEEPFRHIPDIVLSEEQAQIAVLQYDKNTFENYTQNKAGQAGSEENLPMSNQDPMVPCPYEAGPEENL